MDAESPLPPSKTGSKTSSSANLSDLVKEMVKEMDANEFYSRNDLYDDSAEVCASLLVLMMLSMRVIGTTLCCCRLLRMTSAGRYEYDKPAN